MIKIVGCMLASDNVEDGRSYSHMVRACKETWIRSRHDSVHVYSMYGDQHNPEITKSLPINNLVIDPADASNILVNTPENRENLLRKTVKTMGYALDAHPTAEYFFRPNCGSYVNTHLLYEFLQDKPRLKYYSGFCGSCKGIDYCSGACILLSRDLVQLIVDHQDSHMMNYDGWDLMDDVAIGNFLCGHQKIQRTDGVPRVIAKTSEELRNRFDPSCWHYYFGHTINPQLIYDCHELFGYRR